MLLALFLTPASRCTFLLSLHQFVLSFSQGKHFRSFKKDPVTIMCFISRVLWLWLFFFCLLFPNNCLKVLWKELCNLVLITEKTETYFHQSLFSVEFMSS